MPSKLLVIPIRLEQSLYDKVIAMAKAQGRSRSNFVENLVRAAMEPNPRRVTARSGK
jgi:hypothetical protein